MPKPRSHSGSEPPFDPSAFRAMMERALRDRNPEPRTKEDRAQDLVYDAMQASSWRQRMELASQALELDPENVDALLMMVEASDMGDDDRIVALRNLVDIGAMRLGKKAFEDLVPHFWGHIETRPYMRARLHLATALVEAGRLDEAITEFAEMLALNEGDNQAVRYRLLPLLLKQRRLEEARALLDRFEAEWEWAARGGFLSQGFVYSGNGILANVGWYFDNSSGAAVNLSGGRGTWPVGQKAANELGIYDMSGNVWEWCWDSVYG